MLIAVLQRREEAKQRFLTDDFAKFLENGLNDVDLTLNPRYIGPFKILARVGLVAYQLELPLELEGIHDVFHVSNLKKCLVDESLIIPYQEEKVNKQLQFMEEPVEIMDRQVKKLRRSKIPIVKVCWDSKREPEFTWEKEWECVRNTLNCFKLRNDYNKSICEDEISISWGDCDNT
ncbi:hypothetical protein E3N88_10102 [Mikania micrantha]|uniref:Tf2-1-like SH3-like domain-containing protein n=1 Tax=Mikania micrantha TaxID=192012 RepID=A0A5N6P9I8_9ASTR|nr:hypothetical protein E3N88_10102 [Mikania micrantha]